MNQPKLYVGNLNFDATEAQVKELFSQFGETVDVKLVTDRFSGRSRGFAFVTMGSPAEAKKARDILNGQPFQTKALVIDFAREDKQTRQSGDGSVNHSER